MPDRMKERVNARMEWGDAAVHGGNSYDPSNVTSGSVKDGGARGARDVTAHRPRAVVNDGGVNCVRRAVADSSQVYNPLVAWALRRRTRAAPQG
eukprot:5077416-Karenia_brevis.AAC.1